MSSIDTSEQQQQPSTSSALETTLKGLLDKMLNFFETFLTTQEDLTALESKLSDYENILELAQITDNVFTSLVEKINQKLQSQSQSGGGENYDELEKVLQKHEGEIRNHIRIEQQLKLYAESIQAKLDETEKTKDELLEQMKSMLTNANRDNHKLTETLKQKTEENERLIATLKSLEQTNKGYESQLQGLPQLQERINHLEKRQKSAKPVSVFIKNLSQNQSTLDIENSKRIEADSECSRLNTKPELISTRKSIKTVGITQSSTSPLRYLNKALTNTSSSTSKTPEYMKVKVELVDNKNRKELDALKASYQKFYHPNKAQSREKVNDRAVSVTKAREMKSVYSIPMVNTSSNSSLIHGNGNVNVNQQNFSSHRDYTISKLHQRSNSQDVRQRSRNSSVVKLGEGV